MAMGEALLILLIIVVVMAVLAMKRISNDKKAAETLVGKLKEGRSNRDEKVRCMLNGKYHYKDEILDSSVREFSKSERRFYQTFIKTYLNRDYKKLSKLDMEFDRATTPYFDIELPNTADGDAEKERDEQLSRLKKDNKKLKEELGVSMKTLGRMLGEYANILDEEKLEAKGKESKEVTEDNTSDSSAAEVSLSPTLMKELSESSEVIEATETAGLLEISEAETDDSSAVDELLEIEEEKPVHNTPTEVSPQEEPLETGNEASSESESLEILEEADEPATDSVDELLESIGMPAKEEANRGDELSKEVLEGLDKVAHEIDEMVIEEPEETPESDINVLEASSTHIETEVSEESADDIIDELQKAQDLGQEIENLIDMEQDLDTPATEDNKKKN